MSELPESLPRSQKEEEMRQAEMEAALDDALDDTPRSDELMQLRDVLLRRQKGLADDLNKASDAAEREALRARLQELDDQIAVLDEEAKINKFVEDTVKFSHEVRRLSEG
jgi:seryl-tRNA synthetase